MYDREGQPRDFEARERRTWLFNMVICIAFLLILIGVDIGVIILGGPVKEIALGIVLTLVIGVITGLITAHYFKKYVIPKINDTETDPRKTAMYSDNGLSDCYYSCGHFS